METIIAGGRDYRFTEKDIAFLDSIAPQITEVVSGGAHGADSCGEAWAKSKGIPIKVFKADWIRHGKAAGPRRNSEMAAYADAAVLFSGGRGTADMATKAMNFSLTVYDMRIKRTPPR